MATLKKMRNVLAVAYITRTPYFMTPEAVREAYAAYLKESKVKRVKTRRSGLTLIELLVVIAILAIACGALTSCVGCGFGIYSDYSNGSRVGTLIKFSQKGVIWKPWEGTLLVNQFAIQGQGLGSTTNGNAWDFSCVDETIAKQIETALETQQPVTLKYKEWWSKPWSQHTSYTVYEVKPAPAPEH